MTPTAVDTDWANLRYDEDDEQPTQRTIPGWLPSWITVATLAIGVLGVTQAYRVAGNDNITSAFTWFWLGFIPAFVGAVVVAVRHRSGWSQRLWAIGGLALLSYLPMLLRRPNGPQFYDELAHWGQTQQLVRDGQLHTDNIVAVISQYPGLHVLTQGLSQATGLSIWTVAHLMVASAHVLMVLGIAQLVRAIGLSNRVAALAAVVYAANPGFLFFSSMYAYESLAIVWELWAVVAAISAMRSVGNARRLWTGVALTSITAVALTHHLSALVTVAFLLILWVCALLPGTDKHNRRLLALLVGWSALLTLGWMLVQGGSTLSYLGVFPEKGFAELQNLLRSGPHEGTSRGAFGGSTLPFYEQKAAFLAIPLIGLTALIGTITLRRMWRDAAVRWLVLVSVLYPVSLPFILTTTGAPGAHRSWPFTWQALSVLIAVALVAIIDRFGRNWFGRVVTIAIAAGSVCLLLVASQATDFNTEARFPGEYQSGVDARQLTDESRALTTWLADDANGERATFIASDFLTAGIVAGNAGLNYASSFPTWDLTFYATTVKPESIVQLAADQIEYLVIDRRVTDSPFRGGVYLDNSEPQANVRIKPIPKAALTKLEAVDWLTKVYASANYDVYKVVPKVAAKEPIPPGGSDATPVPTSTPNPSATPSPKGGAS